MRWVSWLQGLIYGTHSSTEKRAEQSEYSRKTVRSVEITVETVEVILRQAFKAAAEPETRDCENSDEPKPTPPRELPGG